MPYRCIIIGCGPRGADHAGVIAPQEEYELSGVVDLREEARQELACKYGSQPFPSITEALKETRAEIVVLCTPPKYRRKLIAQILAEGAPHLKAILTEKPLELDLEEARGMLADCRDAKVQLIVGHQLRMCAEVVQMRDDIAAGLIGNIQFVRACSAGALFDQGSHVLDALEFVTGGKQVEWVMSAATEDRSLLERHGRLNMTCRFEDHHPGPLWLTAHLGYQDGIRGTIESGHLYQRVGVFHGDWSQQRIVVYGDLGQAEFQVGSHYRLVSGKLAEPKLLESTNTSYWAGTLGIYRELLETLESSKQHRCVAALGFNAQETMFAALAALDTNAVVELPMGTNKNVVQEALDLVGMPLVSVVIPMFDHRGFDVEALVRWTTTQWLPRHKYQIVAVTHKDDTDLNARIRPLLGKQDKYIEVDDRNLYHHYDLGGRAADASLILFTESHCWGSPECLEEIVKYFATHDDGGAVCRIMSSSKSQIGYLSDYGFNKGFTEWTRAGDFRKVIQAGFVLRREVFEQIGGFQYQYGNYASWTTSVTLHSAGVRMGYAAGAGVYHNYPAASAYRIWMRDVRDYAEGEVRFYLDHPEAMDGNYFARPSEAERPWLYDQNLARAAADALRLELRRGDSKLSSAEMAALKKLRGSYLVPALFGPRLFQEYLKLRRGILFASWQLPVSDERRYRLYTKLNDEYGQLCRLEMLAAKAREAASSPETDQLVSEGEFPLNSLPDESLMGFFPTENQEGLSFRWSQSFAMIHLPLRKGKLLLRLVTEGLHRMRAEHQLAEEDVTIYFNRRRLKPGELKWRYREISFKAQPSWFTEGRLQTLVIVCPALRLSQETGQGDLRLLGLPLCKIQVESRVADQESAPSAMPEQPAMAAG